MVITLVFGILALPDPGESLSIAILDFPYKELGFEASGYPMKLSVTNVSGKTIRMFYYGHPFEAMECVIIDKTGRIVSNKKPLLWRAGSFEKRMYDFEPGVSEIIVPNLLRLIPEEERKVGTYTVTVRFRDGRVYSNEATMKIEVSKAPLP